MVAGLVAHPDPSIGAKSKVNRDAVGVVYVSWTNLLRKKIGRKPMFSIYLVSVEVLAKELTGPQRWRY